MCDTVIGGGGGGGGVEEEEWVVTWLVCVMGEVGGCRGGGVGGHLVGVCDGGSRRRSGMWKGRFDTGVVILSGRIRTT